MWYREISLLSIPSKVHGKNSIRGVQDITKDKVSEVQGGYKTGKGCLGKIFDVSDNEENVNK